MAVDLLYKSESNQERAAFKRQSDNLRDVQLEIRRRRVNGDLKEDDTLFGEFKHYVDELNKLATEQAERFPTELEANAKIYAKAFRIGLSKERINSLPEASTKRQKQGSRGNAAYELKQRLARIRGRLKQ